MSDQDDDAEAAEWQSLYDLLISTLAPFGKDDAFGCDGDYWILDDDYGWPQHKVYFWKLNMLRPHIVKTMQAILNDFPRWDIVVAVDIPESNGTWPEMGLIIRKHEIVDGLQRQYFPFEYQHIQYEGSRVGTDRD